jgi:hydroxymethylglutaryl-CoA lyase
LIDINVKKVKIVEVGPRDGLQNEKKVISTHDKLEYIKKLAQSGLETIEVTSFVSPKAIPQMSDNAELFKSVSKEIDHKINLPCLVPNRQGYEDAKKAGVKEIALFSATSDAFTQKNINCTVDESFARMQEVAEQAKQDGIRMRGYISTAFGCPYAGYMPVNKLAHVLEKFFKLGVYEASIGDTIGVATPKQVGEYLRDLKAHYDFNKLAMHLHDTRSMALTNILVSLEQGISIFDASSGGLGGCPYANGATGNVATEDIIYLFDSYGINHGVNLDKLASASEFILKIVEKETPSKFLQSYLKSRT